jgi:hypothetical protein
MTTVLRRIALAMTGLAVLLALAGPANAATGQVKLRNAATGAKLLTKDPTATASLSVRMAFFAAKPNQRWTIVPA